MLGHTPGDTPEFERKNQLVHFFEIAEAAWLTGKTERDCRRLIALEAASLGYELEDSGEIDDILDCALCGLPGRRGIP